MRTCSRCREEKEENAQNFYPHKNDTYDYYCIECRKVINLENHYKRMANKPVETERLCKGCGIVYPLDNKHFHFKNKARNYFTRTCKGCRNAEQQELRDKQAAVKNHKIKRYTILEKELIEKQYRKTLEEGIKEDRQQGLKFDDLKLTIGKKYSIRIPRREGSTSFEYFIGILMQECKNHLVFKNSKGICESFLKVDLLLEHEYKEVI